MKRVLALICALMLIVGYAVSESQVSPEESTEIVEIIEEPIVEAVEKAAPEEELETFSEKPPEEPIVEEPVVEEPTVEIEEPAAEPPVVEKPVEEVKELEPEPVVEEVIEAAIEPEEESAPEVTSDAVEFEENDWGEITIEFKREVYVSFLREPKHFGDTVTLVATLVNFKPDDQYTIAWQYSIDGKEWISIEGEDERTYTFILDEINYQYSYRALVEVKE